MFLAAVLVLPIAPAVPQLSGSFPGAGGRQLHPDFAMREVAEDVRRVAAEGRWVLFAHDEVADENGDGDLLDRVYAVLDLVTGATSEVGVAGDEIWAIGGGRAIVSVEEPSQGATDLNGDGDALDAVYFGIDLATAASHGSGLAAPHRIAPQSHLGGARLVGSRAVLVVPEEEQGDLDGDGWAMGAVACAWESFSAVPVVVPLVIDLPLVSHRSYVLLVVREGLEGDLNGDGDVFDRVLHAVDLEDPALTPVSTGLALYRDELQAAGPRSAFLVREGDQGGADLNGDGDAGDFVLHVFDADVPSLASTELAVFGAPLPFGHGVSLYGPAFLLSEQALAFAVSEESQEADLNGDGRLLGSVLFVRDFASGVTTNLGLSVFDVELGEGGVAFGVLEEHQDEDLNGDGELEGQAAHLHDLATGVTTNLGLRTAASNVVLHAFTLSRDWLAFAAREDGVDGNGDGDGGDVVLHLLERSSGAVASQGVALNSPVAPSASIRFATDGWLSLRVSEAAEGRDLNGDGDLLDIAVQFVRPETGTRVDPGIAGSWQGGHARRHAVWANGGDLVVVRLRE